MPSLGSPTEPRVLRVIDRLSAVGAWFAAAGLVLLALSIFVDVLGRTFLNMPLTGTLERTAFWWMPLMVLMAFGYAETQQEHIKVTILLDVLPPRMRGIIEGCFGLVGTGLLVALAWHALPPIGLFQVCSTSPCAKASWSSRRTRTPHPKGIRT